MASLDLRADELIFRYEADQLPSNPASGLEEFTPCHQACSANLIDGVVNFSWPSVPGSGDRYFNYTKTIGIHPDVPLPPFWAEWRYSSNNEVGFSVINDGSFVIDYRGINDILDMYGDAVITRAQDVVWENLPLSTFRTFRFETISERDYCFWIDGVQFNCRQHQDVETGSDYLQIYGHGGVDQNQGPGPIINRWDYVRYGRVTTGELVVGADPPEGVLDASEYAQLDRFTVTFDQPNYVFVNEIVVDAVPWAQNRSNLRQSQISKPDRSPMLRGGTPTVIATRRLDNGPLETVEVVLDQPLELGITYRFTFNTGAAKPQTIEYTLVELDPCCVTGGTCAALLPEDCTGQNGNPVVGPCDGDTDGDGLDGACGDGCPTDPAKLAPGLCGCDVSDADSDADSVPDCLDECPGSPDVDSDGDGVLDCNDRCPGAPDVDSDLDTFLDCLDQCPGQDDRIDANSNGTPDCLESPIIPAASTWGLVILAILLLTAAKLYFPSRRPRPNEIPQ